MAPVWKKSCTRICISQLEFKTAVFVRMNQNIYALSATAPMYPYAPVHKFRPAMLLFFLNTNPHITAKLSTYWWPKTKIPFLNSAHFTKADFSNSLRKLFAFILCIYWFLSPIFDLDFHV